MDSLQFHSQPEGYGKSLLAELLNPTFVSKANHVMSSSGVWIVVISATDVQVV